MAGVRGELREMRRFRLAPVVHPLAMVLEWDLRRNLQPAVAYAHSESPAEMQPGRSVHRSRPTL